MLSLEDMTLYLNILWWNERAVRNTGVLWWSYFYSWTNKNTARLYGCMFPSVAIIGSDTIPSVCMLLIFCLQFHHRDPGIVGLLTSYDIPKPMFYGLIADGIHTHPTATRIAHRSHPYGNSLNTFLQSMILIIFQVKLHLK